MSSGDQNAPVGGQLSPVFDPPKKPRRNKFAFACAILASMTSILLGYDTGVMSGAVTYIKEDLKINDVQVQILVCFVNLFSIVGSAAAARTSDFIGRRYTIVFAGAIFFAGAILMGFATNYAFLMVGRFVASIGVGYALMIAPVYTAEVSPASSRGFLTSFVELPHRLGWRFMLGVGALPSVLLTVGVLLMPESPRWLVMQGRLGEAKRILDRTSDSKDEAKLRLVKIMEVAGVPENQAGEEVVSLPKLSHGEGVWKELLLRPTPSVRRMLIASVGIHIFQQASGIDAVVLYSRRIFEMAGITNDTVQNMAVGSVKTASILVATFLLDRIGRRPLLLSSVGGMVVSLGTLGMGLTVIHCHSLAADMKGDEWAVALCVAAALSTVAFFSVGLGPITWVYSSEICPQRLRAQGAGLGVAANRVMSGVLSMNFLSLYHAITIGGAFFLFSGISTAAWLFLYTCLPETQGKTLEEMEALFAGFSY